MARTTAAVQGARGNSASPSNSDVGEGTSTAPPSLALEAGDGSSSGKKTGRSTATRTVTLPNGDTYEGELKDSKRHGRGIQKWGGGNVYDGEWKDDLHHGNGTMTLANGDFYEGEFKEGEKHGSGTYGWGDGEVYEGQYVNGERHGRGVCKYAGGGVYDGEWKDGKKHRIGTKTWENGDSYCGEWNDGEMHGKGTFKYSTGEIYEGEFTNGQVQGWGAMKCTAGNVFEGEWVAGIMHGRGALKNSAGRTLCEGVWLEGVQQGNEEGVGTNANLSIRSEGEAPSSESREQPEEEKRVYNERTPRSHRSQQRRLEAATKKCEHCGVDDYQYKLRVCTGCNLALYCSAACHKAARRSHQRICDISSQLPSRDSDRIILKYDREEMVDFDAGLRYATKYMDEMKHLAINLEKMAEKEDTDTVKLSSKYLSSLLRSKRLDSFSWLSNEYFGGLDRRNHENRSVWKELHSLKQLSIRYKNMRVDRVRPVCDIIGQQRDTLEVLCLPHLQIDWSKAKTRRAFAQAVSACKHLVKLDLRGCVLMDSDLKVMLQDLPNLCVLNLRRIGDSHDFTDNTCGLIARKCPGLQELDIDNHDHLSVRGVRKIFEGCPHMRSFYTSTRKLSSADVGSLLVTGPQLLHLALGDENGFSTQQLDEIIEATGGRTVLWLGATKFQPGSVSPETKMEYDRQLVALHKIWSKEEDPEVANYWADMFEG